MTCNTPSRVRAFPAYLLSAAACGATTALALPLRHYLDLANIVMLFLLVTFLTALLLGRGPAVLSAVLAVVLFDYLFVPPHMAFIPTDAQYGVMLAVMLVVALVTAHLTAWAREQTALACWREEQTQRLYRLARDLAGALSRWDVQRALDHYLGRTGYRAVLYLLGEPEPAASPEEAGLAGAFLEEIREGGVAKVRLGGQALLLPLKTPSRASGVMVVTAPGSSHPPPAQERELFQGVASLVAIAIERLHAAEELLTFHDQVVSERLRASILSALSHDLRTPLTALVGMADSLVLADSRDTPPPGKLAAIRDQARAIGLLVTNLLDMARLREGKVSLHKEWHLFDDLIGASLRQLRAFHPGRAVRVRLSPRLPLVEFDAVLMERVLCNLLENAIKYAPPESPIEVEAWQEGGWAWLAVGDRGAGFPAQLIDRLFGLFERGQPESSQPGAGLGLAICRAIVEAHGGEIMAENRPEGGARVSVRLPLGVPPLFEEESDPEGATP